MSGSLFCDMMIRETERREGSILEKLPHTQATQERRGQLEHALLELMRTKGYAQTTVTDICRMADIPRRTYYHYFDCKESLLHALVENMLCECNLAVMLEFDQGLDVMRESLIRNFRYWQGSAREKLDLLLDNGLSGEMMQCALRWLETERIGPSLRPGMSQKELEILTMVGTSGFFTLLMYWRRNEYQETPEKMAEFAIRVLSEPLFPH